MSVADKLTTLTTNITDAYTAISTKGGTIPQDKNTANLATAITSIPSGGPTPSGPLDPAEVYANERPTDWLPMPTPANNEIYLLVRVPVPNQEKDPGTPLAFLCQTSAGQYQVELGTVTNGEFVADNTYTTLVNSDTVYTNYLYYSDWTDSPMADGTHQVMVKISTVSGDITSFDHVQQVQGGLWGSRYTLEARGRCESTSKYNFGSSSTDDYAAISMRFCSLDSTNHISANFTSMFNGCYSLIAIPQLNASLGTDFSYMFYNCFSLTAIPQLDTSSGTSFSYMFTDCYSLAAIPLLDTSSGTNFSAMFQSCRSLTTIPQLDTSLGTNFNTMFQSCYSLTAIPQLDTSSGTNFNSMFSSCYSLTAIPALNTSSGTNFQAMFVSCRSLTTIPQLDTSLGTNFSTMFQSCYSLTAIPQLDTSSGTNFSFMFGDCFSLTAIPALNTSSGTNFQAMFVNCYSLAAIPLLDTSSGTNFSSMFSDCYSLTTIPALNTSSGTSFNSMFSSCRSLTTIPQLDTSLGTNFSTMFQGCYSLTAIPQLNTSSGTNFYYMFNVCRSLTAIPALNTSSGTNFSNMFRYCDSLTYIDFVGYDFTNITNANNGLASVSANGGGIMRIDNKFQMQAGGFTRAVIASPQGTSSTNPFYVLTEDETAMIPLGASATTVFTADQYIYVVVPDSMYNTYAADTNWATLGARLKKRSEVTLPSWYTS